MPLDNLAIYRPDDAGDPPADAENESEADIDEMMLAIWVIEMEYEAEQEAEKKEEELLQLGATIALGAGVAGKMRKAARPRLYLCHQELMPDPRAQSPWQALYASQNDRVFITTMGFDIATFNLLLDRGFRN